MNDALYWVMLKHEGKKILGYSLGLNLFEGLITSVYPTLVQSPVMEDIPKSFPVPVKRVFGVSAGDEVDMSYEAYISAQLLGRFLPLLISIFGISTANALLSQLLDQGFMAYPLSSPVSRDEIIDTQIGVLLTEMGLLSGAVLGGIYASTANFEIKIARWSYFKFGILTFALASAISAYSLLICSLFGTEEESVRVASALTGVFYGLDVVSCLGDQFSGLKNFTPFGLFRPQEVLQGKLQPTKEITILGAIAGSAFTLAKFIFKQRDLDV